MFNCYIRQNTSYQNCYLGSRITLIWMRYNVVHFCFVFIQTNLYLFFIARSFSSTVFGLRLYLLPAFGINVADFCIFFRSRRTSRPVSFCYLYLNLSFGVSVVAPSSQFVATTARKSQNASAVPDAAVTVADIPGCCFTAGIKHNVFHESFFLYSLIDTCTVFWTFCGFFLRTVDLVIYFRFLLVGFERMRMHAAHCLSTESVIFAAWRC